MNVLAVAFWIIVIQWFVLAVFGITGLALIWITCFIFVIGAAIYDSFLS